MKRQALKRAVRMAVATVLLGLATLTFAGCGIMNESIREDSVKEMLPEIDPEAGVVKEVQVKLYYRLTGEAYLVGVTTKLTVLSNERTEHAMIRELIEGVPPLTNNVSAVMPAGTQIIDVSPKGGILYITLSNGFFNTDAVKKAEEENRAYLDSGFINLEEYDRRIESAKKEMFLVRRLAVLSIVDTVTEYDPSLRVQLLFDMHGSGTGVRVARSELGLEANEDANSTLAEPMEFDKSAVADPLTITKCALDRMMGGEYEKAYVLFAETESGGLQKPTYANFETELLTFGRLTGYTLYSYSLSEDMTQANVRADIEYTLESGETVSINDASLALRSEGVIYKLGYYALTGLMREGAQ